MIFELLMLCVRSIVFLWVLSNSRVEIGGVLCGRGPMNYEEGCPVFKEFLQCILNEKLCLRGYTGSGLIGEENSGIDGKSIDLHL